MSGSGVSGGGTSGDGHTSLPIAEAQLLRWMNDEETTVCGSCRSSFNLFNRRHHCRKCGALFCQDCCSYFMELNPDQILCPPNPLSYTLDLVFGNTVRCCKTCSDMVVAGNSDTRTAYSVDDSVPSRPTVVSSQVNGNNEAVTNNKAPTVVSSNTDNNNNNNNNSSIRDNVATQNLNPENSPYTDTADIPRDAVAPVVMKEVHAMEYVSGEPSKRYIVNVPSDIRRCGAFSVYLDSRIMTVRLTADVNPGEKIYVRAPTANVVPIPAVARAITRDDTTSGSSSITVLITIPCNSCTYENTVPHHSSNTRLRCHFCNTIIQLDSQDDAGSQSGVSSGSRNRVNVLEMPLELLQSEEDVGANTFIKQYSVIVPVGTKQNDIFKVVLSSRLFHVLCAADVGAGDKLIVSAPDKLCPFPLNYRFKIDYEDGNVSAATTNGDPSTATQLKQDDIIDPDVLFKRAHHQRLRLLIGEESNDISEDDKIAMLIAYEVTTSVDDARSIIQSCIAKNAEKKNNSYNNPSVTVNSFVNTSIIAVASTIVSDTGQTENEFLLEGESKESSAFAVNEALPHASIVETREVRTYIMNSRAVENDLIAVAEETILCRNCTSVNHPDARVCLVCRMRFR